MSFETIQALKRDILAGRYVAPPEPSFNSRDIRPQRRIRLKKVAVVDEEEWAEEAYNDDFYEENTACEDDVVPEYFGQCDQLVTSYPEDHLMEEGLSNRPLYRGCTHTSKDLARFLLSFKARHLKVGDGILANIVGILATFLPPDNSIKSSLLHSTSTYYLLKTLDNLASYKTMLRTLKVDCCPKKCMGFYGDNKDLNRCNVCEESRWKLCTKACYSEDDEKLCDHAQRPRQVVYYNVVQDRLVKLLKSDVKNLFDYQSHRGGEVIMSETVFKCLKLSLNV
jgi:hypothetical protein